MHTTDISVCAIGLFGDSISHFWISNLAGITDQYPHLKKPHKQIFYSLICAADAEGVVVIDNETVQVESSKVIVIKPGCISQITINKNAVGKIICFTEDFFSLRYNNNMLMQFSFLTREAKSGIYLTNSQLAKWHEFSNYMQTEFDEQKRDAQMVLRSYLNVLLFELERSYNPGGQSKKMSPQMKKIHEFEALIEKHYQTKKLPSEYAVILLVTPNYLNKICRQELGQTAGEIIRRRISIEAQRLLHYTTHSVSEISAMLGFDNASYFTTFFKKQTGQAPEKFRNNKST